MPEKRDKEKSGTAGRFGPRYGTRVRERIRSVEEKMKGYHRCPECESKKVKRVGSGIWECNRCGAKFTAKAYAPTITSIEKKIAPEAEEVPEELGEEAE